MEISAIIRVIELILGFAKDYKKLPQEKKAEFIDKSLKAFDLNKLKEFDTSGIEKAMRK